MIRVRTRVTPIPFRGARRIAFPALAMLALAAASVGAASAQALADPGACATSRALRDLDRVHAAMVAWYLDAVSELTRFGPRSAAGAPLCPGSPPVDLTQIPPISVEDLRALLVPQYIAAIPAFDPPNRCQPTSIANAGPT